MSIGGDRYVNVNDFGEPFAYDPKSLDQPKKSPHDAAPLPGERVVLEDVVTKDGQTHNMPIYRARDEFEKKGATNPFSGIQRNERDEIIVQPNFQDPLLNT